MEPRNRPQSAGQQPSQPGLRGQGDSAPENPQGGTLQLYSINELARCCSEETNKFLRQTVSNDRYCLELFRRAIVK